MIDFFRLNKTLLHTLKDKFIIFSAGYKGGIGKSVLSLGIARELDIPYITNDKGSSISGNVSFYDHVYLTYDLKVDKKLKKASVVVIDLAGCFVLDKTILKLIKKSNLVILPTGENPYLDHAGCLITARNLFDINKNLLFITSGVDKDKIQDTVFSFSKLKSEYENFDKIKVFGLSKSNTIIYDSISKKRSYTSSYTFLNKENKEKNKEFMKDWSQILKEIFKLINIFEINTKKNYKEKVLFE